MSNTRRWVQPGWNQGNADFCRLYPQVRSAKHQAKDHGSFTARHVFRKGAKNTRYNLRRKIEQLRDEEGRA